MAGRPNLTGELSTLVFRQSTAATACARFPRLLELVKQSGLKQAVRLRKKK